MLAAKEKRAVVVCVWLAEGDRAAAYDKGARDAYAGRRPQSSAVQYIAGYSAQLLQLPTDEGGAVEWFRLLPDGGWKLTDNL